MVVRRFGLALTFSLIWFVLAACDGDDECDEVARQLRACCDKGPAELRSGCVDEAELLENDGNTDACEADLDRGAFARCE
jgi:hypothetical protein